MTDVNGQVPEEENEARDERNEGVERTEGVERVEESSGAMEESESREEDTDQVAGARPLEKDDPVPEAEEVAGARPLELAEPRFDMIDIDRVIVPKNRLRTLNKEDLEMYMESIRQCGCIRQPIEVTRGGVLISGASRLAAAKKLGLKRIPAICHEQEGCEFSEAERELGEIDENLIVRGLNALETAQHILRRYKVLEKMGDTIAGSGQSASENVITKAKFAKLIGRGKSTVKEYLSIAESMTDEVIDLLRNTPLADSKVDLMRIKDLPPEDQRALAVNIAILALSLKEARSMVDDYLAKLEPKKEIPVTDGTDGDTEGPDMDEELIGSEGDKVDSEPVSEQKGELEADTETVTESTVEATPETNTEESADPKRRDAVKKWLTAAGTPPETGTREEFLAAALELIGIVRDLRSGESPRITKGGKRYLELKGIFPELFRN